MSLEITWLERYFVSQIIKADGVPLPRRGNLNFTGDGVIVTDVSGTDDTQIEIPGGAITPQHEGVTLPQRSILNFVGPGVVATDDAANSRTLITINGVWDITSDTVTWAPTGANSQIPSVQKNVTTSDATVTTIYTYAMPASKTANITAGFVARRPSNGDGFGAKLDATYARIGTAAPALLGAISAPAPQASAGASGWTVSYAVSGNNILIQVTGQAAASIDWSVEVRIHEVT